MPARSANAMSCTTLWLLLCYQMGYNYIRTVPYGRLLFVWDITITSTLDCMSRTNRSSSSHRCLYRHQLCIVQCVKVVDVFIPPYSLDIRLKGRRIYRWLEACCSTRHDTWTWFLSLIVLQQLRTRPTESRIR